MIELTLHFLRAMATRKGQLRKEMRQVLRALDQRWIAAASEKLCENLFQLYAKELGVKFDHILAWSSFFQGEPDLSTFLVRCIEESRVYLPRCLEDRSMNFICIGRDWASQIEPGFRGVPEPRDGVGEHFDFTDQKIAEKTLILIPGLAFDGDGNRLGRGAGYYDRFLAKPELGAAVKVGIGWQLQLVSSVPIEPHEIGMDWVCHEEGYLSTGFAFAEDI